jgi:hypothetical protein
MPDVTISIADALSGAFLAVELVDRCLSHMPGGTLLIAEQQMLYFDTVSIDEICLIAKGAGTFINANMTATHVWYAKVRLFTFTPLSW